MSSETSGVTVPFVSGHTKVIGVFGFPVEHSLSPAMHNAAIAALRLSFIYVPFAVRPDQIGPAIQSLRALGIVGVNLTIPHKESVLPFLDEITEEARDVGAVNTVHCIEGRLLGDNTDGRGFFEPLREMGVAVAGKRVVVLGAGGAARAVVFRLAREGAQITLANRTRERAERLAAAVAAAGLGRASVHATTLEPTQELADAIAGAELLIHTTRVGMHPETDALPPVPLEAFHSNLLVYDLVYNPVETLLLKQAQARGCRTLTGVKMLVYQGAVAFQRWTGHWPPTEVMERAVLHGLGAPVSA
jgi:shikimate dehydrogenase